MAHFMSVSSGFAHRRVKMPPAEVAPVSFSGARQNGKILQSRQAEPRVGTIATS